MKRTTIISLLCCIALICGCSKEDNKEEEKTYKYEAVFIGITSGDYHNRAQYSY